MPYITSAATAAAADSRPLIYKRCLSFGDEDERIRRRRHFTVVILITSIKEIMFCMGFLIYLAVSLWVALLRKLGMKSMS